MENNIDLISEQIDAVQQEVLLIRFIFALANSIALIFIGFVLGRMLSNTDTSDEAYNTFLQAAAALFAPYLTIISQGFCYPKIRKLNSLMHLRWKSEIDDYEIEMLYDK
ncbi:hypothetical protein [Hymenobacter sp. GOD-10R]|uniref:hypothetical protein n=1 Tax=Hymenobacter sp. GOD-10R TaxID=3093922 RepID=UPI002D765E43|nr:hypothetical protein [Hymenobacter sp. GOD-10R]WRQ28402.1 hypothetical protein SD425_25355 [Hymenobacter sp. GOD-10R]